MTWEPRQLPRATPESERYWDAAADGRLLLRECADCGLVYHYPRALCPDCLSDDVSWIEAAGRGTVYSYTVSRQIAEWPDEALPAIIAYVELQEGPRMMTCLVDCEPDDISVGADVAVRFVDSAERDDVAIPVFALTE